MSSLSKCIIQVNIRTKWDIKWLSPTEEARGTVVVDEELFIAGARAERVCSLVAHIIILLSLGESKESDEKTKTDHPGQWGTND